MEKRTVLPLLNSAFEPGKALETVEQFEDKDVRNIARAEFFYFQERQRNAVRSRDFIWRMRQWSCGFRHACFMGMPI